MKNICLFTLKLAFCISTLQSFGQEKNFIDQPYIETSARVDTLVSPDKIYLDILISERDTKGRIPVEQLETKMVSRIESLGIDVEKNLLINDLASNFKKYFLKSQDIQKSKSYTLIVENAVKAGQVILELEKIEVSNVRVTKVEYSESENLKLILRSEAIKKAKKQADFLTKPLGQQIGAALFISDIANIHARNQFDDREEMFVMRGNATTYKSKLPELQFEKIKLEVMVNVKFVLN